MNNTEESRAREQTSEKKRGWEGEREREKEREEGWVLVLGILEPSKQIQEVLRRLIKKAW